MILALFELQVALILLTKFQVNWPFGSKEEVKIGFKDGGHLGFLTHLGFSIRMTLAIFNVKVTLILPTKFGVSWPFGSGEVQSRFSRWPASSWICDQNDFSYFSSTDHPDTSYQVSSQLAQGCKRRCHLKQIVDDLRCTMDEAH